jgi:hypothetical protein
MSIIVLRLLNYLASSVPDKGYSRDVSCALNIYVFIMLHYLFSPFTFFYSCFCNQVTTGNNCIIYITIKVLYLQLLTLCMLCMYIGILWYNRR